MKRPQDDLVTPREYSNAFSAGPPAALIVPRPVESAMFFPAGDAPVKSARVQSASGMSRFRG